MNKSIIALVLIFLAAVLFFLLKASADLDSQAKDRSGHRLSSGETPDRIDFKIIKIYPHAPDAFTQGLLYKDDYLYESTGRYGHSSLRKVRLETGEILRKTNLPGDIFGEGIAFYQDKIIQLTWYANIAYIYQRESFELVEQVQLPQKLEGWGLAFDGNHLIMSDGSDNLYFLNPSDFKVEKKVKVHTHQGPLRQINELEVVDNRIMANVWQSSFIVIIDPATGRVTGYVDLSELVPRKSLNHPDHVLNGIAYNNQNGHIYVTGKMWPQLYEIELSRFK